MISKFAFILKEADGMPEEIKEALRTNKKFRRAWIAAQVEGQRTSKMPGLDELEALARKHKVKFKHTRYSGLGGRPGSRSGYGFAGGAEPSSLRKYRRGALATKVIGGAALASYILNKAKQHASQSDENKELLSKELRIDKDKFFGNTFTGGVAAAASGAAGGASLGIPLGLAAALLYKMRTKKHNPILRRALGDAGLLGGSVLGAASGLQYYSADRVKDLRRQESHLEAQGITPYSIKEQEFSKNVGSKDLQLAKLRAQGDKQYWVDNPELTKKQIVGTAVGTAVGGLAGFGAAKALKRNSRAPIAAIFAAGAGSLLGGNKAINDYYKERGIKPSFLGFGGKVTPEADARYLQQKS